MRLIFVILLLFSNFTWAQNISEKQQEVSKQNKVNPYALYYKRTFKQTGEIPANAFLAPESLDVDVLAFGAEYNFTQYHSVRLTGSYVENHIILKGFKTIDAKTKGLSDTRLDYLYNFNNNISAGLGVSAPTGSIDERQDGHLISYPGQLGSGTYDFIPQIEAKYSFGKFSLRPRVWATIRSGRNDQNYRLGDEFRAIVNGRFKINKYLSVTANLHYKQWDAVVGSQPRGSGRASAQRGKGSHGGSRPHGASSNENAQRQHSGAPPEFVQSMMKERANTTHSHHGQGSPTKHSSESRGQGQDSTPAQRGGPPSNSPFAGGGVPSDPFAASGERWGANMGLATGLYLGGGYIFALEAGAPVYYDQNSELKGLEVDWYATGFITKRF